MSCFSCERSPIHARWHVFQAKSIGVMLSTPSTTLFCLALGSPTSARDCTACVRVENMTITVSTDGSALGNPNGPMGWAWADHEQNAGGKPGHKHDDHGYDAGGATNGTNQIGELCAVLEALRAHPALSHCSSNRIRSTPSIARPSGSKAGRRMAGKIHRKNP